MWLIDTEILGLEYVLSPDKHPYAILSHTWEDDEVTFQDMANLGSQCCINKKGFQKIKHTCALASARGLRYAWVDTCCINKESSAELTEAINSMFAWYKKADVCFVYLSDFPAHAPEFPDPLLRECRWWARGWTLQELLAPTYLHFYDCEWNHHGGKRLRSLEISNITGIDMAVLENSDLMKNMPVGRKMSWVARRTTTREEDIAYCLLGIFDVNMSLIYGEGQKAFMRLQEEILRKTNDMTLFAWTAQDQSEPGYTETKDEGWWGLRGILALSPVEFKNCCQVTRDHYIDLNRDFTLTNAGLRIWISLAKGPDEDYIMNVGSCPVGKSLQTRKIGVHLQKTPNGFYRRLPGRLFLAQDDDLRSSRSVGPSTIYIRKEVTPQEARRTEARLGFIKLTFDLASHLRIASIKVKPSNVWDPHRCAFLCQTGLGYLAVCHICLTNTVTKSTVCFFIVCKIVSSTHDAGSHVVVWALAFSESDKLSSPWNKLLAMLNEYIDPRSTAGDHSHTTGVSPEISDLCAQLAESAPTPQWSYLETHRGMWTAVALETSNTDGVRVSFPTAPCYRRRKGRWTGALAQRSVLQTTAVQMTRKLTRSLLGSEESQRSVWTYSS